MAQVVTAVHRLVNVNTDAQDTSTKATCNGSCVICEGEAVGRYVT